MKTADAIRHFGSVRALAEAIQVNRQAIYQWGESVPKARRYELFLKSGGALAVEAPRALAAA
jgi:hypothetical protein